MSADVHAHGRRGAVAGTEMKTWVQTQTRCRCTGTQAENAVTHAGIDAHARAQTDRNRWRHGCRCRQTQRDEEAGAQGYRCRPRWRRIRRHRYVDRAHGLSELKKKALTPAAFLLETHWWANQNLCTVRKHSRACLTQHQKRPGTPSAL